MKQSDLNQAPRILSMIQALTDEECSSVEIHNDNPDFSTGTLDCLISVSGMEPRNSEEFRADTLAECLELALEARGKKVPIGAAVDWAGRYAVVRAALLDILHFIGPALRVDLITRATEAIEAKPELGTWRSQVPRLTDEQVAEIESRWGLTTGIAERELRTLMEDIRTL